MKKELLFSGMIFIALYGCGKNSEIKTSRETETIKDSLTAVIDSIRLANLHKNFSGRHAHPGSNRNLGVHAHQNIPKKIKMTKNRARNLNKAKRIEELQKENRKKILEKEGIISSDK